jgi:hypothetical protein
MLKDPVEDHVIKEMVVSNQNSPVEEQRHGYHGDRIKQQRP